MKNDCKKCKYCNELQKIDYEIVLSLRMAFVLSDMTERNKQFEKINMLLNDREKLMEI